MTDQKHYSALEAMYKSAPINKIFPPEIAIFEGEAEISIEVKPEYFHAAGAMHGSVYFKLLDDSAFFAASSLEDEVFVLTTAFTTYLTRPVSKGRVKAVGKVVNFNRSQFIAESILYDDEGREIARGNGIFVRSQNKLSDIPEYKL